ncbi:hypothetical protein M405DRAFT_810785, partial [Rhizopogon salebrosus TDB-379]
LIGLPSLLSATRTLLGSEPSLTLRLLAYLQNTGKLGEIDIVWGIGAHQNPDRMTTTADGGNEMDPWEEERSWRDPSAHRLCGSAVTWLDRHQQCKIIMSEQKLSDRFDPIPFETRILVTLGQCTSLAEKHNRELATYFLSLAGPDAPSRLQRFKLRAWLKLFSKFSNPRALYATDTLRDMCRSLIPTLIGSYRWHPCLTCSGTSCPTSGITRKSCVYSTKPNGETS